MLVTYLISAFHLACIGLSPNARHGWGCELRKGAVMKNRVVQLAAVFALVVLMTSLSQAQMPIKQLMMRAHIPFAFIAGGVHLPAGDYIVYHPGDPYLVVIETSDGKARGMEYIHPSASDAAASSTKLVFNKYGEHYFIAQVWTGPDREIHQCFKCRSEKALLAQNQRPKPVIVAANH
jgi:hypothetical protein